MKQTYSINVTERTEIVIERGSLARLDSLVVPYNHSAYFILVDANTEKLFGQLIKTTLEKLSKPVMIHVIPSSEEAKSEPVLFKTLQMMLDRGLDRKSAVVAVGGGVVCDLATVVAGLYFRGIDCLLIPTTLLAQVDAALGGKGAISLGVHKNTIGIIRQPKLILIDPVVLDSLPEVQRKDGFAEIVKYSISVDKTLFKILSEKRLDSNRLDDVINRCIRIKMSIVSSDPYETSGERMKLNFGHTLAHAIEKTHNLSHGQAVGIGMHFAINVSVKEGSLSKTDGEKAIELLETYSLIQKIDLKNIDDVVDLMKKDKKTVSGKITFVLLKGIGQTIIKPVSERTIKDIVKTL